MITNPHPRGRPRLHIPTSDAAEICAWWPEQSVRTLARRFGYCKELVTRALQTRYGTNLAHARYRMGIWTDPPPPSASAAGVKARRRNRARARLEKQLEDQMLQFQCYSGGPT